MSSYLPKESGSGSAKGFWHLGLTTNFSVIGNSTSIGDSNHNLIPFDDDLGSLDVTTDLTSGNHKVIVTNEGHYHFYFNANEVSQSYYKFYHVYINDVELPQYLCGGYSTNNYTNQSAGFWGKVYLAEGDEVQLKVSKGSNAMTVVADASTDTYGEFTKTRFIGVQVDSKGSNKNIKGFFHGASSSDISLPVNTLTKVTNMYEVIPGSGATFSAASNKFTVSEAGKYVLGLAQNHQSGYYRYGVIYKNGAELFRGFLKSYENSVLSSNSSLLYETDLLDGDELEFYYIQTSGSTHTIYMRGKVQAGAGQFFPAACYGIRIGDSS